VQGVSRLRLEVECAGSYVFAWPVWVNPRLIK
jgi:hypothetical protein